MPEIVAAGLILGVLLSATALAFRFAWRRRKSGNLEPWVLVATLASYSVGMAIAIFSPTADAYAPSTRSRPETNQKHFEPKDVLRLRLLQQQLQRRNG